MNRTEKSTNRHRAFASVRDIRGVFHEHRAELEWLAYFITGDLAVAAACVTDACSFSESRYSVFGEWLTKWARYATIRSAIQAQRGRIKQLSPMYVHETGISSFDQPPMGQWFELLVKESAVIVLKLDVVSRAALIICGVERNSVADAALMLGISKASVQAAYRAALESLEVIRCEHLCQADVPAALSN